MNTRDKEKSHGWRAFWILLLLVTAALGLALWQWEEMASRLCQPLLDAERARCQATASAQRHRLPEPPKPLVGKPPPEAVKRWAEITGSYPQWPEDLVAPRSCTEVEEDLKAICQELDRRPYLQGRLPQGGSSALLAQVFQELSANPPVASGEMRRPEAVVANAFHLFRVMGRERMGLLLEILSQEQALLEPMAMALYRWLATRAYCSKDPTRIRASAINDYAAFLLNTLGGQGYLRRRPPRVAALATFYALVIMDSAAQAGNNPYGLDLISHIAFCKELLRSQELVFKDRYLEVLTNMEARWGGPPLPPKNP